MLRVSALRKILETEIELEACRSRGPGGQHVNRTSSAVLLRWNLWQSKAFNHEEKLRIFSKLESQLTNDGDLLVRAENFREQEANRKDAHERFFETLRRALLVPKKRVATKPTRGSVRRRHQAKERRAEVKTARRRVTHHED